MDLYKIGEELNHLAGLLHRRAANYWYWAVLIEIVAGIAAISVEFSHPVRSVRLIIALCAFFLLSWSFFLKWRFEDTFDDAETMRRQSVLTEALGWSVSTVQMGEWKRRAGRKILRASLDTSRPSNYYATTAPVGPLKLLEITTESAFWTRTLYLNLRNVILTGLIGIIGATLLIVAASPVATATAEAQIYLIHVIFLLLPAILLFDLLEWVLRLQRLANAIHDIQLDLERLAESKEVSENQVLRLVAEYNCQVAAGFPIHPWLFALWRDETQELWDQRDT